MACLNKFSVMVFVAVVCSGLSTGYGLDIPEDCKNEMFCNEKPAFYDDLQREIDEKFDPIKKKWNLKEDESENEEDIYVSTEDNCAYTSRMMTPYVLKTNTTTKIIVQSSFYKQKFRITECTPQGTDVVNGDVCFEKITGLSKGYCKTKYASIALYVYDNTKSKIERVPVNIPVCCACTIYP